MVYQWKQKSMGWIMHSDKDDLYFIENEYGNRAKDTMANYSQLLQLILQEKIGNKETSILFLI